MFLGTSKTSASICKGFPIVSSPAKLSPGKYCKLWRAVSWPLHRQHIFVSSDSYKYPPVRNLACPFLDCEYKIPKLWGRKPHFLVQPPFLIKASRKRFFWSHVLPKISSPITNITAAKPRFCQQRDPNVISRKIGVGDDEMEKKHFVLVTPTTHYISFQSIRHTLHKHSIWSITKWGVWSKFVKDNQILIPESISFSSCPSL